jgi:hypothetical protein
MAAEVHTAERLAHLRGRVEHWRRTRTKHGPMPEVLWGEAASLARRLGICPVSRALGIGYDSLQQRVAQGGGARLAAASATGSVQFVELSGAEVAAKTSTTGAVVELVSTDGVRLTMRLPVGAEVDVAAVVAAFRGRS